MQASDLNHTNLLTKFHMITLYFLDSPIDLIGAGDPSSELTSDPCDDVSPILPV